MRRSTDWFATLAVLWAATWGGSILAQDLPPTSETAPAEVKSEENEKAPLDHSAYDKWNSIQGQTLSRDGHWVLYTLRPGKENAEATLKLRKARSNSGFEVDRGASARFTADSRFAVYLIQPERAAVKKAEKAKVPADKRPKSSLEILELDSGTTSTIERVKSFRLPEDTPNWVAYHLEKPLDTPKSGAKKEDPEEEEAEAEEEEPEEEEAEAEDKPKEKKKDLGTELVLRNLDTSAEVRFPNVVDYRFSKDGRILVFSASAEEGDEDGVFVLEIGEVEPTPALNGRGNYKDLTLDESGAHLAFLSDRDDYEADEPAWTLYQWHSSMNEAQAVASEGTEGILEGWWVSDNRSPSFSKNGERLYFGTAPKPEEEPKQNQSKPDDDEDEDEDEDEGPKVVVDIWHWQDPQLQPQQLAQLRQERRRTYLAMVPTSGGKVVQLADEDLPNVVVGSEGDADVAIGTDDRAYRLSRSWETPGFVDVYLLDVKTGEREQLLENHQGFASLSPASKYVTWWNYDEQAWYALGVESRESVNLTELLPHPVHNELHDTPSLPGPYGNAGWIKNDKAILIYDRHDLWAVDPHSDLPPTCVTDGVGRERNLRFRYVQLDRDEQAIDPDAPMLLSAFHYKTKAAGFFRDKVRGTDPPEEILMRDESFSTPRKAEDADVLVFTRSTFEQFPDLWVGNLDFEDLARVSDANPHQKDHRWGTAELVEWTSLDGEPLQGILYKPEDFDASKQYPMIVYFYERSSDGLHRYVTPASARASINYSLYVSRGYLVFVPDIPYRVGAPGQSAVNAILPGVSNLIDKGFVDPKRIGVQGHSWGGYQVSYLVTRTNLFACAEAGAPVSNMTSAYGGIRWSSGLSRMFQYERTQSRIGGNLWEAQQHYIENSPLFWADRVETPLLILHNDQDGAVPWYQGIELFVALRRLGKPAWMFNYNGEDHGLTREHNRRDWSIRLQQFFDHYLQDAPPPVWLAEGVPALSKGKNLGLDLIETDSDDKASK